MTGFTGTYLLNWLGRSVSGLVARVVFWWQQRQTSKERALLEQKCQCHISVEQQPNNDYRINCVVSIMDQDFAAVQNFSGSFDVPANTSIADLELTDWKTYGVKFYDAETTKQVSNEERERLCQALQETIKFAGCPPEKTIAEVFATKFNFGKSAASRFVAGWADSIWGVFDGKTRNQTARTFFGTDDDILLQAQTGMINFGGTDINLQQRHAEQWRKQFEKQGKAIQHALDEVNNKLKEIMLKRIIFWTKVSLVALLGIAALVTLGVFFPAAIVSMLTVVGACCAAAWSAVSILDIGTAWFKSIGQSAYDRQYQLELESEGARLRQRLSEQSKALAEFNRFTQAFLGLAEVNNINVQQWLENGGTLTALVAYLQRPNSNILHLDFTRYLENIVKGQDHKQPFQDFLVLLSDVLTKTNNVQINARGVAAAEAIQLVELFAAQQKITPGEAVILLDNSSPRLLEKIPVAQMRSWLIDTNFNSFPSLLQGEHATLMSSLFDIRHDADRTKFLLNIYAILTQEERCALLQNAEVLETLKRIVDYQIPGWFWSSQQSALSVEQIKERLLATFNNAATNITAADQKALFRLFCSCYDFSELLPKLQTDIVAWCKTLNQQQLAAWFCSNLHRNLEVLLGGSIDQNGIDDVLKHILEVKDGATAAAAGMRISLLKGLSSLLKADLSDENKDAVYIFVRRCFTTPVTDSEAEIVLNKQFRMLELANVTDDNKLKVFIHDKLDNVPEEVALSVVKELLAIQKPSLSAQEYEKLLSWMEKLSCEQQLALQPALQPASPSLGQKTFFGSEVDKGIPQQQHDSPSQRVSPQRLPRMMHAR